MKLLLKVAILIGVPIFSMHCLGRKKEFDVTIVNSGDHSLKQVVVIFENFNFKFGYLIVSKNLFNSKTYGSANIDWPRQIEVNWIEESIPEVAYNKIISIRPRLHPTGNETLELMIRVENGKICVYPKIWSIRGGLKYR